MLLCDQMKADDRSKRVISAIDVYDRLVQIRHFIEEEERKEQAATAAADS
jgi:hypothetical protein